MHLVFVLQLVYTVIKQKIMKNKKVKQTLIFMILEI